MSTHGGARRNAGRPSMRPSERRQIINFSLSPKTLALLRAAVPYGRRTKFVEEAVLSALGATGKDVGI